MATAQTTKASENPEMLGKAVVVSILVLGSFLVLWFARASIVAPFDALVTEQACVQRANELGLRLDSVERSNSLALFNRTDGACRFGPDPGGSSALVESLDSFDTGTIYTTSKFLGIVLQLGFVSMFLRLAVDPLVGLSRTIRDQ